MAEYTEKTILLVEDDLMTQKATAFVLKKAGFQVIWASTGEEAVQIISEPNNIQLVLMDIDLGSGMDGTETARHILTKVRVPIVFHTSHSEKAMVDKVRGITRYGYVVKNSGDFVLLSSIDMAFELFEANLKIEEKMETVLRTEKRFADLITNLQVGILVQGPNAEIMISNDKALELLGVTQDQLLGKTSFDPDWNVIHRDGSPFPGNDHPVPTAIRTKKPIIGIIMGVFRPLSGDRIWLLVDAIPHLDQYQQIIEVVCTFTDISTQINFEDDLSVNEEKYNFLSEHLEDMVFRYELKPAPKFTYVSPSSTKIIGYTPEEHYADPELGMKLIHPEDREKLLSIFATNDFSSRYLFRWITKSGSLIWTEQKIWPIYHNDGSITAIKGHVKDVTSQYFENLKAHENFQKLESLINSVEGIVWEFDIEADQFTYVSSKTETLLGYKVEEWYSPHFWSEHVYEEDREAATEFYRREAEALRNHEYTYRFVAADGRLVWLRDMATVIHDGRKPLKLIGLLTDISELKKLELELRESKDRLKRAQQVAKLGSWVWYPNGRIIWSDQMYDMYQVPRGQAISFDEYLQLLDDDQSLNLRENFMKQLTTDRTIYSDEGTYSLKDGSQKTYLRVGEIVRDKKGNVIQVNGVTQDITDRKKVEFALLRMQNLYEKVSHLARVGGWEFNPLTRALLWSSVTKEIHDVPDEYQPDPESVIKFYKENGNREKLKTLFGQQNPEETTWDFELSLTTKNGKEKFVRMIGEAEIINGKCTRIYGAFQDITQQVEAENKIKSLLTEKEILLKEVHHRIKNNMSTVVSLLSLHADSVTEKHTREILEESGNRVRSMIVLYDRLFLSLNFRELPLTDYLYPLSIQIHRNFEKAGKVALTHDLQDVVLSSEKLFPVGIIVNELITNSMKYAFLDKENGKITISSRTENGQVSIMVEDNGKGSDQPIDFENSPGFGLQLVSLLTKQLKGTIHSTNESGTKVTITFKV